EKRGHYGQEIHEALVGAGLYRMGTPKKYGGLEADMATYARLIIEISRGDPSTGWCWCLGHNHNLTTAAHWPAAAQDEVFQQPGGYFRSSHSVAGNVVAVPVDGGFRVDGRSPYQSGVPYSTHVTVNAVLEGRFKPDGTPVMICAIIPIDEVEVLDDWGGDRTIGMRGSGSNSVVVRDVFVPEHRTCLFDWMDHPYDGTSPGVELHGNPLYLGPVAGYFHLGLGAIAVGAAYAAVDEYEHIISTRSLPFDPTQLRRDDPMHQADFGRALSMAEAAEAIIVRVGERFMEFATDAVERGVPFTMEMDGRLYGMAARAGEMASEAVDLLFRSAGSAAATRGHSMERYYRDVAMYRGHGASQYASAAMKLGQIRLGLRDRPIGPPTTNRGKDFVGRPAGQPRKSFPQFAGWASGRQPMKPLFCSHLVAVSGGRRPSMSTWEFSDRIPLVSSALATGLSTFAMFGLASSTCLRMLTAGL
ncbi:MAG: hypothetical protein GEV11_26685, partial [Streptosporangiales bacterium]|nr:hypothetical protein [Streptosporangiales bacterium]